MNLSWLKIFMGEAKTKLVLIEDGAQELGSEIISELNIEHIEPAKEESFILFQEKWIKLTIFLISLYVCNKTSGFC